VSLDSHLPVDPPIGEPTDPVVGSAPATAPLRAPGSSDEGGPRTTEEAEVHFHFPVTVEIIGVVDPGLEERIVAQVFQELNDELACRP
jgi:hypothetical protein